MAEMGNYCKAYLAKSFRAYPDWQPKVENLRPEDEDGENPKAREALADDDILYLQEDFVVTDGIFKDEHVVFDQVTDAWRAFCTDELDFAVPEL